MSAGLEPADLTTYKPVLVNTAHILERDKSGATQTLSSMKQAAQMYGAINMGDTRALVRDIETVPEVAEFLDEHGLEIAEIPLVSLGLGNQDGSFFLPVPKDLDARLEEALVGFLGTLGE